MISKGKRMAGLPAGFLLVAAFLCVANAATRNNEMRMKVVNSETRSDAVRDGDVPKNCDGMNYDAYCDDSKRGC